MPAVVLLPQALAETYKFDPLLLSTNNVGLLDSYQLAVYEHNHNVLYGNTSADFIGSQPPIGKWSFHDAAHTTQIKTGAGHTLRACADC